MRGDHLVNGEIEVATGAHTWHEICKTQGPTRDPGLFNGRVCAHIYMLDVQHFNRVYSTVLIWLCSGDNSHTASDGVAAHHVPRHRVPLKGKSPVGPRCVARGWRVTIVAQKTCSQQRLERLERSASPSEPMMMGAEISTHPEAKRSGVKTEMSIRTITEGAENRGSCPWDALNGLIGGPLFTSDPDLSFSGLNRNPCQWEAGQKIRQVRSLILESLYSMFPLCFSIDSLVLPGSCQPRDCHSKFQAIRTKAHPGQEGIIWSVFSIPHLEAPKAAICRGSQARRKRSVSS